MSCYHFKLLVVHRLLKAEFDLFSMLVPGIAKPIRAVSCSTSKILNLELEVSDDT